MPVDSTFGGQQLLEIDKFPNGNIKRKNLFDVSFVPLTDKSNQFSD